MVNNIRYFEKTLWAVADKMISRLSMLDYKYVVVGLIFLKYILDAFEKCYEEVKAEGYGLEDERDSYAVENRIKRDALERFARNSKDILMISYNELYERTEKIVNSTVSHNFLVQKGGNNGKI